MRTGLKARRGAVAHGAIRELDRLSQYFPDGVHYNVVMNSTDFVHKSIGEVLVLMSVFVPTAFVSGITGQLYKQFALTIAISTAFSGFNALTLTPALCALFLEPPKESKFIVYRWFNRFWTWFEGLYTRCIGRMLKHDKVAMLVYLAITIVAFWGFIKWPTSYIPTEDMGHFMTSIQLPPGASLERTQKVVDAMESEIQEKVPEAEYIISLAGQSFFGGSGSNGASFMIQLKPWSERKGKETSTR